MGRKTGGNKSRFWIPLSWFVFIVFPPPGFYSFMINFSWIWISFIAHNMYLYLYRIPLFFLNDPHRIMPLFSDMYVCIYMSVCALIYHQGCR